MSSITGKQVSALKDRVEFHSVVIIGVVVVVVIGFAAMLVTAGAMVNDSLAEKKAISQDMRDQIKAQNDKIEALSEEIGNMTRVLQNPKTP